MAATNHAGKAEVARAQINLLDLCDQGRLRSAFATLQSDRSLCCLHESFIASGLIKQQEAVSGQNGLMY